MIRFLDILFSLIGIFFLTPLFFIIILILSLTGEREVFFVQTRVGKGKRNFGLLKFATMLKDSPNMTGGDITSGNDSRVLPFGQFLRKSKINELPQLWNVLKGDLSIVGPRPLTPKTFEYYSYRLQNILLKVSPGLTGIGSIFFRDEENAIKASYKSTENFYREDIAPYKGELESWYVKNASTFKYILIILATIWVVLFPKSNILFMLFPSLPSKPKGVSMF